MYELGDKVIYQGVDEKVYKKHGVVKSIEEKHGKPQLIVELENGETFTAPIDDWSREFSNACKNAKFKVGDRVKDKTRTYMGAAKIIDETDDEYVVKFDNGPRDMIAKADVVTANACTSTNVVIRNAVAARNALVKKQFGNVTAFTFGAGLFSGINVGLGPSVEGDLKDVIAKAKPFLAEFEKAVSGIKQAIAWLEQNAK